jgi:hypothetical protein
MDGAMVLLEEQECLCREIGNRDGLQRTFGIQAAVLQEQGDLKGAMALLKAQERLCLELGNPERLSISLAYQAQLLNHMSEHNEARRLAADALAIASRHGYKQLMPQFQRIRDSIPPRAT